MNFLLFLAMGCFFAHIKADDLMCHYNCEQCKDDKVEYKYCGPPASTTLPTPPTASPTTTSPTTPSTTTEAENTDINQAFMGDISMDSSHRNITKRFATISPRDTSDYSYTCYRADYKDTWRFGCLYLPNEANNECKFLIDEFQAENEKEISKCSFCRTDGCNNSDNAKLSFIAFLSVFVFKFML